jgi:hypothetical protein
MDKAVNFNGYGRALLQQWKDSVFIHTYKHLDKTAVIIEVYMSSQLIPCSEVIIKIISVFWRCIIPQLLTRKWEFKGGSTSAQLPVHWVMGLFPRGKAVEAWC